MRLVSWKSLVGVLTAALGRMWVEWFDLSRAKAGRILGREIFGEEDRYISAREKRKGLKRRSVGVSRGCLEGTAQEVGGF